MLFLSSSAPLLPLSDDVSVPRPHLLLLQSKHQPLAINHLNSVRSSVYSVQFSKSAGEFEVCDQMLSSFDRWEKDPFFLAAEEVQDSADRMASLYRNWMYERKDRSTKQTGNAGDYVNVAVDLHRELHTALGTAKWQLEEFDRASRSSDDGSHADEDVRIRHAHFVSAIGNQILTVEDSLKKSNIEEGESGLSWVQLDEEERDELAAFLSGATSTNINGQSIISQNDERMINGVLQHKDRDNAIDSLGKPPYPAKTIPPWKREEKVHTHHRTASVGNEIGAWMVSITNENVPNIFLHNQPRTPLAKVLSMPELEGTVESSSKMKSTKNGFCKWRASDRQNALETIPLQNRQELNCYERSKECVCCCDGEPYDKQVYGLIGALKRQLQRSHYQIQYGRPVQVIFWITTALLLIVLFIRCSNLS